MYRLSTQLLRFAKEPFKRNVLMGATTSSSSSSSSGVNEKAKDPGIAMKTTIKTIGLKFPSVQNISTSQLNSWLGTPEKRAVALIDCREDAEFAISHIMGAIHAGYDKAKTPEELVELCEAQLDGKPNPTIVCYCSVGYRSSDTIQKLTKYYEKSARQSRPEMFNLCGSLFQWAQERRLMVDHKEEPTPFVHPYSGVFGKLVDKELRKETL